MGASGKAPGAAGEEAAVGRWRQLEKVPEKFQGGAARRAGENRKRRMGRFSGIPPSKDSKERSGNCQLDSRTSPAAFPGML